MSSDPPKSKDDQVSRRGMIRTLGLGLGLSALPSYVSSGILEVPMESLDPGEIIIPVDEVSLVNMEAFVLDCVTANKESNPQEAIKEVMAKALKDPSEMLKAIGEPTKAGLKVYLRSKELTIFAATWTPQMNLMPHNHHMWANIGIYTGREDNILWHRTDDGIKAKTADCLFAGDVGELSSNSIHSVTNPLQRFTGGIHIYGGDFITITF
jgi:predicted metal-dependent enzyme (double-stranded beta helix superfamily)